MNTQLKQYLDNLFTGVAPCEQAAELREELLANMQEKYEDLRQEGMAEQEAIAAVIAGFGSAEELLEGLPRLQTPAPFVWTWTAKPQPSAPTAPPFGTGDGGLQWRFPSIGITQITVEARALNCRILVVEDSEFVIRFLSNFGMETEPPQVRQTAQCLYVNAQTQKTRRLFQRREKSGSVELYLPRSFTGLLQIRSLSGEIRCDSALTLAQAQLDTVSGEISLAQLRCKNYRLKTISGDISVQLLDGISTAEALQSFGELHSVSGDVKLQVRRLAGSLNLHSVSGDVSAAFDAEPDANLHASTVSGEIRLGDIHHQGRGSFSRVLGQGRYRVEASAVSGDVLLTW